MQTDAGHRFSNETVRRCRKVASTNPTLPSRAGARRARHWLVALHVFAAATPTVARGGQSAPAPIDSIWAQNTDVEMALPPGATALNGSIARVGDAILMAYRLDGDVPYVGRGQHLCVTELGADLQPVGPVSVLETRDRTDVRPTAEDPRLIDHDGVAFVVYNSTDDGRIFNTRRSMYLAELRARGPSGRQHFSIVTRKRLLPAGLPFHHTEKNWTPFSRGGALHFIYSTNPPHVFMLDANAWAAPGAEVVLREVSRSSRRIFEPLGRMRGGSPALYDAQRQVYVSFFHTQLPLGHSNLYFAGLYTFSPDPPFDILQVLPYPLVPEYAYRDTSPNLWVVYPAGFLRDGDIAHVSYGQNDRRISRMSLRYSRMMKDLKSPQVELVDMSRRL